MKTKQLITSVLLFALLLPVGFAATQQAVQGEKGLEKPGTLEFILYDANQIRSWVGNNGHIVSHIPTGDAGLEWPKGSGRTAVFASGLWVVGKVDGEIRSAAAEFTSEFQPGNIIYDATTGTSQGPDNPNDARFQVSSINKGESSDINDPAFSREYATWPSSDGAPAHDGEYFTDANDNGVYDAGEDFEDFDVDGVYDGPDGMLVTGEDPPLITGDQMHWFVINDADENTHANLWSTRPLGIEIQTTVFGFDRADPLGNIMFVKWLVINKRGGPIDDIYMSLWSDADVGDANDDYVGCDTSLSVGYFYNGEANDQDYGLTPPSVGYDFFQGPIVESDGDTALVSGTQIADFANLPMTSFVYYQNGGTIQDPENAEEAYNFMQGFDATGEPFLDPEGVATKFLYAGDPRTRSGWTQFDDTNPQDHRFLMSTGPFQMETWIDDDLDGFPQVGEPGVQEVVAAIVIAAGTNNLNAVDAMKFFDQFAQSAYDAQFNLPSPSAPAVEVSELDQQIILNWYDDAETLESFSELGYDFEGYNVYQGESEAGPWHRVATFDVTNGVTLILDRDFDIDTGLILEGPVQFGDDGGVQRMIDIRSDIIRGNAALINNRTYYYAVTTYAYNPDAAPKTVEASKQPIIIRPHTPGLGQILESATGDDIGLTHVGIAETQLNAEVVDPLLLTGDEYAVEFAFDSTTMVGDWYVGRYEGGAVTDTLFTSTVLDSFTTDVIEGFRLTVKDVAFDAQPFATGWRQTANAVEGGTLMDEFLAISPGGVDSLVWSEGVGSDTIKIDSLYGPTAYYDYFEIEERVEGSPPQALTFIQLFRETTHDVFIGAFASEFGSLGDDLAAGVPGIGGGITDTPRLQADIEIRFTETGSNATPWPSQGGFVPQPQITVPYEIWDSENDVQLCIGIVDWNNTGTNFTPADTLDPLVEGTLEGNDWVVVIHQPYETYKDSTHFLFNNPNSAWAWIWSPSSKYSLGDTLAISFLNPVKPGEDQYLFQPTALETNLTKAQKEDQLDMINVFPNPYFGYNVEETAPLDRFVRFTHLPEGEATIRIYSLGGHFVRKIEHGSSDFAGTTVDEWDLTNDRGIPVASGMYIIHIEVPDVGDKILKAAIFQPEERLDVY